jgi:hypothetical protein
MAGGCKYTAGNQCNQGKRIEQASDEVPAGIPQAHINQDDRLPVVELLLNLGG